MLFVGKKDAIQNFNKGHNKARKIMHVTGNKNLRKIYKSIELLKSVLEKVSNSLIFTQ